MADITVIRTTEELDLIASDWSALLTSSNCDTIFLQWDWIRTWIEVYLEGDELLCLVVKEDDRIIGLAPFWVARKSFGGLLKLRIIRFLGSTDLCPDHMDIIAEASNAEAVAGAVLDYLYGPLRKEWDIFEYHQVPSESKIMGWLWDWAEADNRCLRREIRDYSTCPYVELPDEPELLLRFLRSSRKKRLTTTERRLSEEGKLELVFCKNAADVTRQIDEMITLHTARWKQKGEGGSFSSPTIQNFHHRVAEKFFEGDRLFLCVLYHDGKPIGSLYGFTVNKTVYYYSIAVERHPNSRVVVGDYLMYHCLKRAIELSCTEFDLLRGAEPYKYLWTDRHRRDLNVDFYNKTVRSLTYIAAQMIKQFGRAVVKGFLTKGSDR